MRFFYLGGNFGIRDGRYASCTRLGTRLGFEKTKPENEEKRAQRIMHSAQVQHWKWESRRKISYTPFGKNIQMTHTDKNSLKRKGLSFMVARTNSSDVGSTTKIIKLYVPHCSSMLNEPFLEKREEAD